VGTRGENVVPIDVKMGVLLSLKQSRGRDTKGVGVAPALRPQRGRVATRWVVADCCQLLEARCDCCYRLVSNNTSQITPVIVKFPTQVAMADASLSPLTCPAAPLQLKGDQPHCSPIFIIILTINYLINHTGIIHDISYSYSLCPPFFCLCATD